MKAVIIMLCLLTGICPAAIAQQKARFQSINMIGLLEGEKGSSFTLTTTNGFRKGNWFLGLGTGLDYYKQRSVPLLLNLTGFLGDKSRGFYLSLDGGTHFTWGKDDEVDYLGVVDQKYVPRFGGAISAGYRIGLKNKKDAVLLNFGYAFKHIRNKVTTPDICGLRNCNIDEIYDYRLRTIMLRIGWMF